MVSSRYTLHFFYHIMSLLILFVKTIEGEAGANIRSFVIPAECQTDEFLTLCGLLDGKMPGEDGDTLEEFKKLSIAGEALETLCEPYECTTKDHDRVALPAGVAVTRVVTVNYSF